MHLTFNSNLPIYFAAYIVLPCFLLYKIRFVSFNNEVLSTNNTNILRGFFALVIVFHHLAQRMVDPVWLALFSQVGYLSVGVFFFLSGYGVTLSFAKKESYLDGFLTSRFFRVYLPYILINIYILIFAIYTSNLHLSLVHLFWRVVGVESPAWFVFVLIGLYIIFHGLFTHIPKNKAIILLFICCISFWLIGFIFGIQDHWYNSSLAFPLGCLFAMNKDAFLYALHSRIGMLGLYFAFLALFLGQYCIGNDFISFMVKTFSIIPFVGLVLYFFARTKITSPVLEFIGTISLEVYLLHVWLFSVLTHNGFSIFPFFVLLIGTAYLCQYISKTLNSQFIDKSFLHLHPTK